MNRIKFDVEWIHASDSDLRRANTAAEFVLLVNEVPVTRLFDTWSRTVSDRARLPMYPLAEWLAFNWWRLHAESPFEPGARPPPQWRLAHDLGAIGGGFVWPRIRFASDDQAILVSARALRNALWEPVRHLNDLPQTPITTGVFDQAADEFIAMVIRRLEDLKVNAEPLSSIWSDVLAERADAEVTSWRMSEARLGYGPDEAPDEIMREFASFSTQIGAGAAAELAPMLHPNELLNLGRLKTLAVEAGVEARLPPSSIRIDPDPLVPAWEIGRQCAHEFRNSSGLPAGPVETGVLASLLGVAQHDLEALRSQAADVGLGVRLPENRTALHFRKRNLPGRRFEAARFLADHLMGPAQDMWLPLTDRATARQKRQRAFAAEFLAPINELEEFVGQARIPERIEDAGEHFGLSPLAVRSHLANHGLISAEEVQV